MSERTTKTVLITGATGGIGREFCLVFASNGYDLVITGRSGEKLNEIKTNLENTYEIIVTPIPLNLYSLSDCSDLLRILKEKRIVIDVLVNNAGTGVYGNFSETDFERELEMIYVNIVSLTFLTKVFLKEMIKRNSGKILNVASTASFRPGPLMSVYYATKAYVLSFSEAIAAEIKNTKVTMTVLCPGKTNTGFFEKSTGNSSGYFQSGSGASPKEVALFGFRAMNRNKLIVIHGLKNKIYASVTKFIPNKILLYLMYIKRKNSDNLNKNEQSGI